MSVLLADAAAEANNAHDDNPAYIVTPDVLYADDTMIVGSEIDRVQKYLDSIAKFGRQYGLELNMSKTVLLRIRSDDNIIGADGQYVKVVETTTYLGNLLSNDG